MQIEGKNIAQDILEKLRQRIAELQATHHIAPHLAVIRVGEDPAVTSYVNQKVKTAEKIGITVTVYPYPDTISEETLFGKLQELDNDKATHAIILQLPIPQHLDKEKLLQTISPKKDVDGFHPDSQFIPPLATAVEKILQHIFTISNPLQEASFDHWLQQQNIVVFGKGKTGGQPILSLLQEKKLTPIIIDSKTENTVAKLQKADIIIAAVGRQGLITKTMLKPGVILIGIGMTKNTDGKFSGDYNTEEIKDIAGFYTPIPGGVGPVNVATLMENVVLAAERTLQ